MIVGETKKERDTRTATAKSHYASEKDFEDAGGHLSYWKCGDIHIPEVHSYPYLGVVFTHNLDFSEQWISTRALLHRLAGDALYLGAEAGKLHDKGAMAFYRVLTASSRYMLPCWAGKQASRENNRTHKIALGRVIGLSTEMTHATLAGILLTEMGQTDAHTEDIIETLCAWERLTRKPDRNAATKLFRAIEKALENEPTTYMERKDKHGYPQMYEVPPPHLAQSFNQKCHDVIRSFDDLPESPSKWNRQLLPGPTWRQAIRKPLMRAQMKRLFGSKHIVSPVGRYANARLLYYYEPAHPDGSYVSRYASSLPHVLRMRLQMTGIASQDHNHNQSWRERTCRAHPTCRQKKIPDSAHHAMCHCPGRLPAIKDRDIAMCLVLKSIDQIPELTTTYSLPPIGHPEWLAMILGAPVHVFKNLRSLMSRTPKPPEALALHDVYMEFMALSNTFINKHIPHHSGSRQKSF